MELFQERGYDETTAAQIAGRAGVTERTFFRHFKDKREVLFDGEEAFREVLATGVASAAPGADALSSVLHAFRSAETMLHDYRDFSKPRQSVIDATPALQERMLAKTSGLIHTLSGALRLRGVEADTAVLMAQVGAAIFGHALRGWFADPEGSLGDHLDRSAQTLRGVSPTAEHPPG